MPPLLGTHGTQDGPHGEAHATTEQSGFSEACRQQKSQAGPLAWWSHAISVGRPGGMRGSGAPTSESDRLARNSPLPKTTIQSGSR
jgi:hypothetical protein